MPGIEIGISLIFVEEDTNGSFCSVCNEIIITKMHKLYISVNSGDSLDFDLLPTKYQMCTPCKIESEKE
jgi:hypothetical protein